MHIEKLPLSSELRKILENCYIVSRASQIRNDYEGDADTAERIATEGFKGATEMSDQELVRELHGEVYETTDLITISDELLQPKEAVKNSDIVDVLGELIDCPDLNLDTLEASTCRAISKARELRIRLQE